MWGKLIDFSGHDEVARSQAINFVCPQSDFSFAPTQQNVGMMSLSFRYLPHTVDEIERLLEIGERKISREVVFIHHCPLWDLLMDPLQFYSLERRHASAARDTVLAGKIFRHGYHLFYCGGRMST